MADKKYTKERLEKSRLLFIQPKIKSGISYAIKTLEEGNMTEFLSVVTGIDSAIEHHIINNCTKAEDEDIRIDCITKANNLKIRTINKLSEVLAEKCGGDVYYIEEIETKK